MWGVSRTGGKIAAPGRGSNNPNNLRGGRPDNAQHFRTTTKGHRLTPLTGSVSSASNVAWHGIDGTMT
eukprot:12767797-Heterocapsa_arctica.AAC.1